MISSIELLKLYLYINQKSTGEFAQWIFGIKSLKIVKNAARGDVI
jgi:hypothetical protein